MTEEQRAARRSSGRRDHRFGSVGLPRDREATRGNLGPFLAPDALFPVRIEPLGSGEPLPEPDPEAGGPEPEHAAVEPPQAGHAQSSVLARIAALLRRSGGRG